MELKELEQKLRKAWCLETCEKSYRDKWSPENCAWGQCAVTAAIVQDYFGGDVMRVHDNSTPQNVHYYNLIDGKVVDLTGWQYGDNIPAWEPATNANGVMGAFTRKSKRYALLKQLAGL